MANRVLLGILAFSTTNAIAGVPALGVSFGQVFGTSLPIVGGGLLAVAAVSLLIGVRIARRKKKS